MKGVRRTCVWIVAWAVAASLVLPARAGQLAFTDVTGASGIDMSTVEKPPQSGNGMAVLDWDADGWLDVLMLGGFDKPARLYRNLGGLVFAEVPGALTGLDAVVGDYRGVALADYDGDGDLDACVAMWLPDQPSALLRNDNGVFVDVAQEAGVTVGGDATACAWADYDGDGLVDLYFTRYWGWANELYHNEGDGTFTLVNGAVGLPEANTKSGSASYHAAWFDVDHDGDLDLYVANDRCYNGLAPNQLWRNDGGVFVEEAAAWGLDVCIDAMGLSFNDFDGDGFLDIYITNVPYGHVLLKGGCDGFADVAAQVGALTMQWGWTSAFEDLDYDGWPDLYIATAGYISYEDANWLLQNQGGTSFVDVAHNSDAHGGEFASGGLVWADFDKDGDVDFIVGQVYEEPYRVLRNDSTGTGHWLGVRLDAGGGPDSFALAAGARVEVLAEGRRWVREVVSARALGNEPEAVLRFGLGKATAVAQVAVRWLDGSTDSIGPVAPDQVVTIAKGSAPGSLDLLAERCGDGVDNDCDGQTDEVDLTCPPSEVASCDPTLLVATCAPDDATGGPPLDAGSADAGALDAGPTDAGPTDAGSAPLDGSGAPADASPLDAGGPADAAPDAFVDGASSTDSAVPIDAGSADGMGPGLDVAPVVDVPPSSDVPPSVDAAIAVDGVAGADVPDAADVATPDGVTDAATADAGGANDGIDVLDAATADAGVANDGIDVLDAAEALPGDAGPMMGDAAQDGGVAEGSDADTAGEIASGDASDGGAGGEIASGDASDVVETTDTAGVPPLGDAAGGSVDAGDGSGRTSTSDAGRNGPLHDTGQARAVEASVPPGRAPGAPSRPGQGDAPGTPAAAPAVPPPGGGGCAAGGGALPGGGLGGLVPLALVLTAQRRRRRQGGVA